MPSLQEVREFIHFLAETYGAFSSLLILILLYVMHQLRCEQKENRDLREQMAQALENNVAIQMKAATVLNDIRGALNTIRYKLNALSELKDTRNAKGRKTGAG